MLAMPDEPQHVAEETSEWLDAVKDVLRENGSQYTRELLEKVTAAARSDGVGASQQASTPYINTLPPNGDQCLDEHLGNEERLQALIRWNAMAIVLQANKASSELGGHIASYQSAATLYEIGFNHFWRARTKRQGGDLLYIQGHSAPGIYARAYLEGRLEETRLRNFRKETAGDGLSSYPHPWLMPSFWQFPTVSMGLGPLMAIYQARFMRYLQGRGIQDTSRRRVWAFMGDGEMDEPESTSAIALAGRERLDNLIFVINCNLQRLDGPVRGNGKIIQELEATFHGAGWNVIKVVWGSRWDPLLAADQQGRLKNRMDEALDGDYQTYKSRDGAYVREHFFGTSPELQALVEHLSDKQIWALERGGHDPRKVHAAYAAAVAHRGSPTVILAKTVKGYGMGVSGEGQNITHQQKKMTEDALLSYRDRFGLPLSDEQARAGDLYRPPDDSPELVYLKARRDALGGPLPARHTDASAIPAPALGTYQSQLDGTSGREVSTTMAFVRILAALIRDKQIGERVVPIIPDEARTFGIEGMFRQLGIFSAIGQLYEPEDAEQLASYKESQTGQILQEGINEAGAFASWLAAATSYTNHGEPMIPFYIFYSMFGFQRIGDLAWAAGDSRARGFLIGGTAGRTTLNGEGLQHEDGHSHLLASVIPNCRSYDPSYGYELAVIIHDGLKRQLELQEDAFYYLTVMNENYAQPPLPPGSEEGILKGLYPLATSDEDPDVRLLGSGAILKEALAAGQLLRDDYGVNAQIWSATSFSELRRDSLTIERENRLHPTREPRRSYLESCLGGDATPTVAATDYIRSVAEQIRPWLAGPYCVLGTDGYGRSDRRAALRSFFEVDRHHIVQAALHTLGRADDAYNAINRYEIDADSEPPWAR
jgi:pyruvate dehydrogenase E1 component